MKKAEKEIIQRKSHYLKLKNLVRCYQDNTVAQRKKQPRNNNDDNQAETQQITNSRIWRFDGKITPTSTSYLSIDHKE